MQKATLEVINTFFHRSGPFQPDEYDEIVRELYYHAEKYEPRMEIAMKFTTDRQEEKNIATQLIWLAPNTPVIVYHIFDRFSCRPPHLVMRFPCDFGHRSAVSILGRVMDELYGQVRSLTEKVDRVEYSLKAAGDFSTLVFEEDDNDDASNDQSLAAEDYLPDHLWNETKGTPSAEECDQPSEDERKSSQETDEMSENICTVRSDAEARNWNWVAEHVQLDNYTFLHGVFVMMSELLHCTPQLAEYIFRDTMEQIGSVAKHLRWQGLMALVNTNPSKMLRKFLNRTLGKLKMSFDDYAEASSYLPTADQAVLNSAVTAFISSSVEDKLEFLRWYSGICHAKDAGKQFGQRYIPDFDPRKHIPKRYHPVDGSGATMRQMEKDGTQFLW